eukprot:2460617-Pyramimonas_sp.AAC.1
MLIFPRGSWKPPSGIPTAEAVFRVKSKVREALTTVKSEWAARAADRRAAEVGGVAPVCARR